jgi:hypothetical protein
MHAEGAYLFKIFSLVSGWNWENNKTLWFICVHSTFSEELLRKRKWQPYQRECKELTEDFNESWKCKWQQKWIIEANSKWFFFFW